MPRAAQTACTLQEACVLPCFRSNPFAGRIVRLVSEREDGALALEELLELMGSVFRPGVPTTAKHVYAFALWDFDGKSSPNKPR